ncbi:unnamed protein product [Rotaria sordida]|uniref:Uncharacterized protein n=1 Tax=Rotaria sordida TaxID=392033 RepID=A0A818PF19_9BILA|nr:unnamed protein product [Rotaria sordida]CAF3620250.1 unnamed protein product [Rotaria sordida]
MPRKNAMRDNVSAVRSQLPDLSNLSREKIELALLYYELNVDETVEAFKQNGAIEALSGWTEMNNNRGNNSTKRTNNKPTTSRNNKTTPSNGILRPSQRVSNIFQTFAEGGIPTITTNGNTSISNTEISSSSFDEQSNNDLQTYPSTDISFHPCLSQDSTTNNSESLINGSESTENNFHDTSNVITTDEIDLLTNHIDQDNHNINETNGYNGKSKRRRSIKDSNDSISSMTLNHDQTQQSLSNDIQQSTNNSIPTTTTTTIKPVAKSSSSANITIFSNNRKLLTKSTKDLQRQTSTLTNVELSFENEIKSSIKRIDDVFKQIHDIIKEREVELYLEIDKVKEQGLNIIRNRQQRATELRQRMDRCDRLEPLEIDHLRNDVKQFVTDRRYDLGEELTSSHRFQYDQTIIDALKNFGTVLRIDRKYDRSRTLSTSSSAALVEQNSTTTEEILPEKSIGNIQTSFNNIRTSSSTTSNEHRSSNNQQQPLPQRIHQKQNFNGNNTVNHYENSHVPSLTNGFYQYYDDSNNYQNVNYRRRPQQQKYPQHFNENTRRSRPIPSSNNNRRNGYNNSETKPTHRNPQSSQTIAPLISN